MSPNRTGPVDAGEEDFRWSSVGEDLNTLIARSKEDCSRLSLELQSIKAERLQNELLARTLLDERQSKTLIVHDLKSKKALAENQQKSNLALVDELKSKIEKLEEERFSDLDTHANNVNILTQRFQHAPARYHIDKITADIESYNEEILKIEEQLKTVYNPEISRLDSIIENEPETMIDIPGLSPRDYSANELSILVSRVKEDAKSLKQMNEDLRKKKEELKKKEDLLLVANGSD